MKHTLQHTLQPTRGATAAAAAFLFSSIMTMLTFLRIRVVVVPKMSMLDLMRLLYHDSNSVEAGYQQENRIREMRWAGFGRGAGRNRETRNHCLSTHLSLWLQDRAAAASCLAALCKRDRHNILLTAKAQSAWPFELLLYPKHCQLHRQWEQQRWCWVVQSSAALPPSSSLLLLRPPLHTNQTRQQDHQRVSLLWLHSLHHRCLPRPLPIQWHHLGSTAVVFLPWRGCPQHYARRSNCASHCFSAKKLAAAFRVYSSGLLRFFRAAKAEVGAQIMVEGAGQEGRLPAVARLPSELCRPIFTYTYTHTPSYTPTPVKNTENTDYFFCQNNPLRQQQGPCRD